LNPNDSAQCLFQLLKSLQNLDSIVGNVFQKIGDRVLQEKERIQGVGHRIDSAHEKIQIISSEKR
jgi:hypothetical protein